MSATRRGLPWEPEEDAALAENYPLHGSMWDGWEEAVPGRSSASIRVRANALGLRVVPDVRAATRVRAAESGRPRWTDSEVARLATWYPLYGPAWSGWERKLRGRKVGEISAKAKALGIRRRSSPRPVTKEGREIILAAIVALACELRMSPGDVADEVVRLGWEYERRAS